MAAPMTPEQFGDFLKPLIEHSVALSMLPLDLMAEYVEVVESVGDGAGDAFTAERRETTTHTARLIAAAMHLRETASMGGKP